MQICLLTDALSSHPLSYNWLSPSRFCFDNDCLTYRRT